MMTQTNSFRQQPVGGYLTGNVQRRDFTLQTNQPRLPAAILRGLHSQEPDRRKDELARLGRTCQQDPALLSQAMTLAMRHLQRQPSPAPAMPVVGTLRYEPDPRVRAQAAATLATLLTVVVPQQLPTTIREGLTQALDDEPMVARVAAGTLAKLADGDERVVPALLQRLHSADDSLFLDLVGAIGDTRHEQAMLAALREALRRRQLVPCIGPDLPPSLTGLPNRATLARQLAEYVAVETSESLAAVAESTMQGNSRFTFASWLRNRLDNPHVSPAPIYRALAKLPIPFWISCTYDNLLMRALQANAIMSGNDTHYWQPDRPTLVRLVGSIDRPDRLRVIALDYEELLEQEGERKLLVSFLRDQLQGKLLLFLGYDPHSTDFALLVTHVLNEHLAGVNARAFGVWATATAERQTWGNIPIPFMRGEEMRVVQTLAEL
jgi:hypothetical protein